MRIAMIGQKGIPSRMGGVEIHVEELAKRLVRQGHSVTVYCRKTYCQELKPVHEGINLKYIPSINTKHLDAIIYSVLATFHALLHGFDVFHFHALGPSTAAFLPRLLGKKVVCTIHGLDWQRDKWGGFARKYLQLGEACIAKFADTAITVSENLVSYFRHKYKKEAVFIPNGVNIPDIKPADLITSVYGLKKNDYILYLGRLVPEKGIHYLIDAYSRLKPSMKLVIAGGSSHTTEYVEQIHEMAAGCENILFTGFVQGEVLEELFSNAWLYVLPSDLEGMPISLLEAMSYGQACLVSDIEENKAVVGKHGFYFSQGNANSLYQVLKQLVSGNQSLEMVKASSVSYVRENFSWDDVAIRHNKVYEGLQETRKHKRYEMVK
ncbi:MAG: glycosyltransferase family 4 protein [Thermoclostridium sp.]|nr:glycosyltransferase family 4 protein [Thermoclostridium sp.]